MLVEMITSNDFSDLKESHLHISSWISQGGGYPMSARWVHLPQKQSTLFISRLPLIPRTLGIQGWGGPAGSAALEASEVLTPS